jgi:hypothetical protein
MDFSADVFLHVLVADEEDVCLRVFGAPVVQPIAWVSVQQFPRLRMRKEIIPRATELERCNVRSASVT